MARITVEDCIDKVDSPYELVMVAKERAVQLNSGIEPTIDRDNDKNTVISLREIAEDKIFFLSPCIADFVATISVYNKAFLLINLKKKRSCLSVQSIIGATEIFLLIFFLISKWFTHYLVW